MIQELIDQDLIPKPRERSGKYSPSSLGGCYRKQWWNRKDEPKTNPPDARTLRVFKVGHMFEQFVVERMKTRYPDLKTQVEVEDEDFKGFADFVLGNEVSDVKSMHSRGFHWLAKADDPVESKVEHAMQVTYYAMMLGLEKCRLIYVSKDDLCINEYAFPTNRFRGRVEAEICDLRQLWLSDSPPPPLPRAWGGESNIDKKLKIPKECGWCNWRTKCGRK